MYIYIEMMIKRAFGESATCGAKFGLRLDGPPINYLSGLGMPTFIE